MPSILNLRNLFWPFDPFPSSPFLSFALGISVEPCVCCVQLLPSIGRIRSPSPSCFCLRLWLLDQQFCEYPRFVGLRSYFAPVATPPAPAVVPVVANAPTGGGGGVVEAGGTYRRSVREIFPLCDWSRVSLYTIIRSRHISHAPQTNKPGEVNYSLVSAYSTRLPSQILCLVTSLSYSFHSPIPNLAHLWFG